MRLVVQQWQESKQILPLHTAQVYMRTCPWLCVKQTLRGLKAMRGLVHVVVSEVREHEQDGMELQEVEAVVLDDHVGMETDKRGPRMRKDPLLSVETAMAPRQAVREVVWSAHIVVLMVQSEGDFHHHP